MGEKVLSNVKKSKKSVSKVKRILSIESLKPINKVFNKIDLKKLRANMIYSGKVVNIYVDGEVIPIDNSWIEMIILLLSFLHSKTNNKLLKTLIDNKIVTSGFDVTSKPTVTFNSTANETYSIPDTGGLYLITNQNPLVLLCAIKGIVSALDIEYEKFKLDVVPLDSSEMAIKLSTGNTTLCTKQLILEDAARVVNNTASIEAITICERRFEVSSFLGAVELIITFINNNFTEEEIKKSMVCNISDIGISDREELEGVDVIPVENTNLWLYYSNNQTNFVEYMYKIATHFGIEGIVVEIRQEYFGG